MKSMFCFSVCAIVFFLLFFSEYLRVFLYQTPSSSLIAAFQTNQVKTSFKLDIKQDVIVFLHIQKTGGKMFDSILVHSLNVNTPCLCIKPIASGCRCRGANGHIWLYSRLSTNWMCGVHADWTELHECVPRTLNYLEKNFDGISLNRRYRYITILREPVARYLSEWLHTQRGADWPTLHKCRGHLPSLADFPPCRKGLTWINVSLEAFMNCSTNPARNRQTYMLANMRQVNCYNLTGMDYDVRQKKILSSAKTNLLSMPFYAMTDFMNESIFLLQHSMGISLKNRIKINPKPRASSLRVDQQILEKIKELNRLDIELYDFAKKLFFLRLKSVKEDKFNPSTN